MINKKESIRLIQSEVPDRAVQGFMIGQTMGGHTLGILRIEVKHVNCKSCVHKISKCRCDHMWWVPEVGKRSLGVRRRFLETRFEGVEFIVQLLLLGLNLEIISFIICYHTTEARVKAKMGQLFMWSKPKQNLAFIWAN